jgi:hypothetical protein
VDLFAGIPLLCLKIISNQVKVDKKHTPSPLSRGEVLKFRRKSGLRKSKWISSAVMKARRIHGGVCKY